MKKIIMILTLMLAIASSATAIGITPATKEITLTENTYEHNIRIVKEDSNKISLSLEGDFAKYANLEKTEILFSDDQDYEDITIKIALPKDQEITGGLHELKIIATTTPITEGNVLAQTSVVSTLNIRILREGIWPIINFYVPPFEVGKENLFITSIENAGKETLKDCYVTIKILNDQNKIIQQITSKKSEIKSAQKQQIPSNWTPNTEKGIYTARANIICQDFEESKEKKFSIGKPNITIRSVILSEYVPEQLLGINISVNNDFPQPVNRIFLTVSIKSEEKELTTAETQTFNLQPRKTKTIQQYIDLSQIEYGLYVLEIKTNHDRKTETTEYPLEITPETAKIRESYVDVASKLTKSWNYAIIIIIIVIIAMIITSIYFRKRKT